MELWILWLIAFLLLAVIEVITQWLTTFCFAVGCLVALLFALFEATPIAQLIALGAAALLSFIIFAPYFQRLHQRIGLKSKGHSNMDALIGRIAVVNEDIVGAEKGRVKVDGDNWQARSFDGSSIAKSEKVEIVDYDSIVLIVRSLD